VSPSALSALPASVVLRIDSTLHVRARLRTAQEWSGQTEARFSTGLPPVPGTLALTEIQYHPAPPSASESSAGYADQDDFEFLELTNTGDSLVDLSFLRAAAGFQLDFSQAENSLLPPGATVYLTRNPDAFRFRYANKGTLRVLGPFAGGSGLSNGGERLVVQDAGGLVVAEVDYSDQDPWPSAADGDGPSLEIVDPELEPISARYAPANWRASATPGGSVVGETGPGDPFVQWLADQGSSNPLEDPDGDGYAQIAAYVLGIDVDAAAPAITFSTGQTEHHFSFIRRADSGSVAVLAEWSPDLATWETLLPGSGSVSEETQPASHPGLERVLLRWTPPQNTGRAFVRLRMSWGGGE
jgi:hypothetical protein